MNIQQLREQIAALQDATMDGNKNFRSDYDEGKFDALTAIDNVLDSLQEEPSLSNDEQKVSNAYSRKLGEKRVLPILKGDLKHKFLNEFNTLYQTLDMQLCDRCMKEPLKKLCLSFATWGAYNLKHIGGISKEEITKMDSLPNEPVSDDFEMALAEMIDKAQTSVVEPWIIAAQWKDELIKLAKSEEPVSEDLGDATNNYCVNVRKGYPRVMDETDRYIYNAFEAGAQWQKEQLMAKAIDGVITFDYYGDDDKEYGCIAHDSFCLEDFGVKDKDNVRMFLFKE